jgi:hypothetical protein
VETANCILIQEELLCEQPKQPCRKVSAGLFLVPYKFLSILLDIDKILFLSESISYVHFPAQ